MRAPDDLTAVAELLLKLLAIERRVDFAHPDLGLIPPDRLKQAARELQATERRGVLVFPDHVFMTPKPASTPVLWRPRLEQEAG